MSLVLKGGDLIKTTKSHMRITCRKLKSQFQLWKLKSHVLAVSAISRDSADPRIFLVIRNVTFRIPSPLILYIPSLLTEMVRSLLRQKP